MNSGKQKGKGKLLTIIVLMILAAGIAYAMKTGLIPGFESAEKKISKELKKDVEGLKGGQLKEKAMAYLQSFLADDEYLSEEDRLETDKLLNEAREDLSISLNYGKLEEVAGKAAVVLTNPAISFSDSEKGESGRVSVGSVEISRDVSDAKHYFYKESGDVEFFANIAGEEQKLFGLDYKTDGSEIKFNDKNEVTYSKSRATDLHVVEGRAGTVLARIGEVFAEQEMTAENGKLSMSYKTSISDVEPGDMVKLMLGAIEPISVEIDFDYDGDDPKKALRNWEAQTSNELDRLQRALKGEEIEAPEQTKQEKFSGDLGVRNLSILMGDSGFIAKADLRFEDSIRPLPKGEAQLIFANYQNLISYLTRFFPVPQEEIDTNLNFLREIGEPNGDDIVFNFSFDGTEDFKLGGKTMQQLMEIQQKYLPVQEPVIEPKNSIILEEQGEILGSRQNPISTPQVEARELSTE